MRDPLLAADPWTRQAARAQSGAEADRRLERGAWALEPRDPGRGRFGWDCQRSGGGVGGADSEGASRWLPRDVRVAPGPHARSPAAAGPCEESGAQAAG